jgi:plasmid stabilization system protein ParE
VRVEFSLDAEIEFDEATAWYFERDPDVADRFVVDVENTAARIVERPTMRAEIEPGVRRALLHDFPYSLIYRLEDDCVFVLAVMHHKRHPTYWHDRNR